jgi:pyruvate dehydrogenase E1 component beta subunit
VIFLESEMMYGLKGEVPDGEHVVPLALAEVKRPGKDVTIVTYSKPVRMVLEAAEALAAEGIDAEVVDLRSLRPLDERTVYDSVVRTNRCVVVDESMPFASVGSHVAWLVSRNCFDELDAAVELVSGEDVPMPYNHALELAAQPSLEKIMEAVKRVLYV